jgi:hypothetical protein
MENSSFRNLCLFHTLDGLRGGLSHFSGMSRAAIIFAIGPDDPVYVYDPKHLLHGHEPKSKKLYLKSNEEPVKISGQQLEPPLDLRRNNFLDFLESLSKVDGALHIGADLKLHGFACLLDGRATPTEDRARGARYNSALRFTAEHDNLIIIVVSADRPVSVIQEGLELNAQCEWKPVSRCAAPPRLLEE